MSTTFSAALAVSATVETPCDFPGCCVDRRCGYCRDGIDIQLVSGAPEVNFASGNATALLDLLALPVADCGRIDIEVVPLVRQTLQTAMNLRRLRAPLDRAAAVLSEPGLATVVIQGNDDERILERLMDLDAVLAWAETHGSAVCWG